MQKIVFTMIIAMIFPIASSSQAASTLQIRGSGCASNSATPDAVCESVVAIQQENGRLTECEAVFKFHLDTAVGQWTSYGHDVQCSFVQNIIPSGAKISAVSIDARFITPNSTPASPPRFYWFSYTDSGIEKFKVCNAYRGGGGYSYGAPDRNTPIACADFTP